MQANKHLWFLIYAHQSFLFQAKIITITNSAPSATIRGRGCRYCRKFPFFYQLQVNRENTTNESDFLCEKMTTFLSKRTDRNMMKKFIVLIDIKLCEAREE